VRKILYVIQGSPGSAVDSANGAPGAAAMRLSRNAKCAGKRLRVRLGLCPARMVRSAPRSIQVKDGPALRTLNDAREYMLDHLPEADQARQSWQKAASCFSLRLMAWMTSALRPGKPSLRYSCRPKLVPQRT
jgi:hypothetical protein